MEKIYNKICEYGCGQPANYQLKNKKVCCSKSCNSCEGMKRKNSESQKGKFVGENHWAFGKKRKSETKRKIGKKQLGHNNHMFLTLKKIQQKYPLFSKIEDIRYNPDNLKIKEIQVRCKNHNCENSKEQGGWFTPTRSQLYERIRNLEKNGTDSCYFYCSDKCKAECPLYRSQGGDPFKSRSTYFYNSSEYEIFKSVVMERDNRICQFCGEEGNIVHHEKPQKLEPFFALDPDYAWCSCETCHYEKGHTIGTECSTGSLAKRKC